MSAFHLRFKLLLGVLLFSFLFSCGGGGSDEVFSGLGTLEGFAFRTASNTIVLSRSPSPPTGTTPLSGAALTVPGTALSGTTDASGFFRLNSVPSGSRRLRLSASGVTPLETPLTVIGDRTLQTGEPTISRDTAIQKALAEATKTLDRKFLYVVASRNPLPPGTMVYPSLATADGSIDRSQQSRFETEQWLVYVDAYNSYLFTHPVQYYFIDAQTGAVTRQDADSWPRINGVEFFRDHDKNRDLAEIVQEPTEHEIVPPTRTRLAPPTIPTRSHVEGCTDGKTFALVVQGGDELAMYRTDSDMSAMLDKLGVPAGNRTHISPINKTDPLAAITTALNAIKGRAKPCDTVLVFVFAHGYPGGGAAAELDFNVGINDLALNPDRQALTPDVFDFSGLKACHLHLYFDTCWSGKWITALSGQLQAMTGLEASIITSTDADHRGIATGARHVILGQAPGLQFSKYFTAAVSGIGPGTYNPVQAYSRTTNAIADDTTGISWNGAYARLTITSNPQIWVRTRQPSETCAGETSALRFVKFENTFLPEQHANTFRIEAVSSTGAPLTYTWSWSGGATACGSDGGSPSGASTRLYIHEGCSGTAESSTTVTVTVKDNLGNTKTYTHGLRQEGSFDLSGK